MIFLMANWRWIAIVLLIATNVGTFKLWRGAVQDLTDYTARVEALGEQAKKETERINAENKANKEKTDANYKRTTAALQRELNRLRLTSGGNLSSPPASADSPDRTCFDPAKFATALRELDQGLLGVIETGSQAVVDLDSAKEWAKGVAK